jgi:hypothetical protein
MSLFAYPNQRYSSQLGLALFGQEEIIAENFLLIDAAYAAGSSISVNGTLVPSPNLSSTLPAAPAGNTIVSFQFDVNGNISGYVPSSVAPILPVTKAAIASNWLNSYNAATGLFTATQPNYTDIAGTVPTPPSGSVLWSAIGNAAAALTLANANYATTFNQTSAVPWAWANTTVATVSTTNASPLLELAAQYWATGAVTGTDLWTIGIAALTAGLNSPSTLTFTHTGSTGSAAVRVPLLDIGGTDAGISRLAANNIGFGNGTAGDHTGTVYLSSCVAQSTSSGGCGEVAIQTGNSSHTGYVAWTDQSGNRTGYMGYDATSGTTADISLNISGGGSTSGAFNILSTVTRIGATDTGISRLGAASIAIGNGTAGDTTGNLSFNRVSLAGADYAGQATVTAAATTKAVTFAANYTGTAQPVIVLTPTSDPLALGVPVGYWVTYSGGAGAWTGFTVNIQTALAGNVTFNYIVIGKA